MRLIFLLSTALVLLSCNDGFVLKRKSVSSSIALDSAQMSQANYSNAKGLTLSPAEGDVIHNVDFFSTWASSFTNSMGMTLGDRRYLGNYARGFYDEESGFLFLVKGDHDLTVFNTKKTVSVLDDVTIAQYDSTTTPALSGLITTVDYDIGNHLLYIGAQNTGIIVIDTNGTTGITDDSLVGTYDTSNLIGFVGHFSQITVDETNDAVWFSAGLGLSAIKRNGTLAINDDTIPVAYASGSVPIHFFDGAVVSEFTLDFSRDQILVNTLPWGGSFYSINTNGTVLDQTDDSFNFRRQPTTTGAGYNAVYSHDFDPVTGYAVLYSWGETSFGQIEIIDTKLTPSDADDVLVKTYSASDIPGAATSFKFNYLRSSKTIYLTSYEGVVSIALNTLSDPSDDVVTLDTDFLASSLNNGNELPVDQLNGRLYLWSSFGFLEYLPGKTVNQNIFISPAYAVNTVKSSLSWEASGGGLLSMYVRTADSTGFKLYNQDSASAADWADFNGWGSAAGSVTNIGGIIRLSSFPVATYSDTVFDTGEAADFFPAGSSIKARVRANCSVPVSIWVYEDDWWSNGDVTATDTDWKEVNFSTATAFSRIGIEVYNPAGQTLDTVCTSVDIDSIEIALPDSYWSSWTAVNSGEIFNLDFTNVAGIQYKAQLTSLMGASPVLKSVTLKDAYMSSGEAVMDVTFDKMKRPEKILFVGDIPSGTSVAFSYSLDNGTTWNPLTVSGTAAYFPGGVEALTSFKLKTTLSSSNPQLSPSISSIRAVAK